MNEKIIPRGGFVVGPNNYTEALEWANECYGAEQAACQRKCVDAWSDKDMKMLMLLLHYAEDTLREDGAAADEKRLLRWCASKLAETL